MGRNFIVLANRRLPRGGRLLTCVLAAVCGSVLVVALPGAASAGTTTAVQSKEKGKAKKKHKHHRIGGPVRTAWPLGGKKPADPLARWLARQVGPGCPKRAHGTKKKHRAGACPRLRENGRVKRGAKAATLPLSGADRGPKRYSSTPMARIAASGGTPLALTRSYQIPTDDPAYKRLLNWAWTYDSAVSASSLIADRDRDQARQLLDQLAALQFNDGSIDIAFDVATGRGAGTYRAGTIAWAGLAFTRFDSQFGKGEGEYRDAATRAADYLLSLRGGKESGLIAGGPRISWYSTQHNLLAYFFLTHLSADLKQAGDEKDAARYAAAAAEIGEAIDANLLVDDDTGTHFVQGLGDSVVPFDVQAYGAMYLQSRGDARASAVLAYASQNFAAGERSIVRSTDENTFNDTYSAEGPFNGFKPYAEESSPDVLWFEATPMLRQAVASLGEDTKTLDAWISSWREVTAKGGGGAPLQSDRALDNAAYGVEYHVWPAAAPAAWVLLGQNDSSFFTTP
jgi:hypothetical protein